MKQMPLTSYVQGRRRNQPATVDKEKDDTLPNNRLQEEGQVFCFCILS
jgi:hypothetical protein